MARLHFRFCELAYPLIVDRLQLTEKKSRRSSIILKMNNHGATIF